MQKSILFIRPSHDQATACLHYFSGKLIEEIKGVGEYSIINLEKHKATREIFEKRLTKSKPRLVVLNGHGFKHGVCGQDKKIILWK